MVIQTINTSGCCPQTIVIGRRGTYDTMQIAFDLSYLVESFGNGVAVLAVKRSQDESAYPAIVTQEDATLLWIVNETDTAYVGSGECQLMWYVDGGLAKTIIYPMVVMRDILQTAEQPPDGYENWIEHLTELGAETQQNAQNAAQSASDAEQSATDAGAAKDAANEAVLHYPKIENGYWYVWDVTAQAYQNTNIKADGDDGYSPEVTITSIEGGHRITITDKDHPQGQSFDVLDGQGGGGTSDYTDLTNKPQINGHTLTGNQTAEQLDLATPSDIPTDAGDIEYDESATYQAGSVGAELSELNRQLSDVEENQIPELKNAINQLGDVAAFKEAILQLAQKVAYIDGNGGAYYSDLYNALHASDITSISAVYSPTSVVVVGDSLDSIKRDLTVTATYIDGTTRVLDDNEYVLTGTFQAGTNTIIVSCVKETTITVQAYGFPSGYTRYDYVRNVNGAGIIDTGLDGTYASGEYAHLLKFRINNFPGGSNPIYGIRATNGAASAKATGRAYWLAGSNGNNIAANYNGADTGFITHISRGEIVSCLTEQSAWYINGSLIQDNLSGDWSAPPGTILLYACRQNTTSYDDLGSTGNDIFTLQVKDQDTNTFIAALMPFTNDNGIPGFYDVIRGSFHTAANNSNITVGNEGES